MKGPEAQQGSRGFGTRGASRSSARLDPFRGFERRRGMSGVLRLSKGALTLTPSGYSRMAGRRLRHCFVNKGGRGTDHESTTEPDRP